MHFVDAQTHGFDYRLDFNDWYQYLGPEDQALRRRVEPRQFRLRHCRRSTISGATPATRGRARARSTTARARWRSAARRRSPEQDQFESFVARESVRFLKNHGKRQPFFLISSFLKPHDPFMPARALRVHVPRREDMKLPDTWGKVDLTHGPARDSRLDPQQRPHAGAAATPRRPGAASHSTMPTSRRWTTALGQVLTALRELDLEKDTIVLYTADHGEMLGEHGLWQKFVFYEPSVGVPLIVRVPGITPAGARSQTPVSLVQVLPTLLDLCGLPARRRPGWRKPRAGPARAGAHARHHGLLRVQPAQRRARNT